MAHEYLEADVHGLFLLADLVDRYWREPGSVKLAAEIRMHRTAFGLTPIDRRRLQWEASRAEQPERKRSGSFDAEPPGDPRKILKAL